MSTNIGIDRPVRYAVVGIGYFAQDKVLPSMAEAQNTEIVALVSGSADKCKRVAKTYGAPYYFTYDNYRDCVTHPDVDAVYIVLPNALHEPFTIEALESGKHVLCEKPMAATPAQASRMMQASRRYGARLMIGYRMHFEPTCRELREKIRQNAFGTIKHVYSSAVFNMEDGWRLDKGMAGGGALVDIGIYPLNTLCWLLRQLPVTVEAYTWSTDPVRYQQVEENITFRLLFSSGLEAQCMASYGAASYSNIVIGGEKGWMELTNIYNYAKNPFYRFYTTETQVVEERHIQRGNEVQAEIEHFSQCILENKEPEPMAEEGYRDQVLMAALYQSVQEKRTIMVSDHMKTIPVPSRQTAGPR